MDDFTFISNLKQMADWDEQDYLGWCEDNYPTGTELEKIRAYLDDMEECPEYTDSELREWTEEHRTAESPELTYLMETIIYQFYLIYLDYIRGIEYM